MKRALKILISLLLVAVVLLGSAWFFLYFRPGLTGSFCLGQAERAMAAGRSARAIRWYSCAMALMPEDSGTAARLSEAYQQAGNYTKAEYALVSAIAADPENLSLYLKLSKLYVDQDKLLDAEQLLSRATSLSIRDQLAALRPASPTLQPQGGEYDEYIEVSLAYAGGTACLATDGDFPSLAKDAYTGPVALEETGKTIVTAVVVSEDGLVSVPVSTIYLIGGIVEEVVFQDAAVETAVRDVLDRDREKPVMSNEMWSLTTLTLPPEVQDLSDLLPCRSLSSLTLNDAYGVDLTPVSKLASLESLDLSGCTISSGALSAIAALPKLTELRLSGCALTDISALSTLRGLTVVDLSNNTIQDISPFQGMASLQDVNLNTNAVESIEPLVPAAGLAKLDISDNRVEELGALEGKTALVSLLASGNKLTGLEPLASCAALEQLDVSGNKLTSIDPVSRLESLKTLLADENQIDTVPDFSKAQSLNRISLNYNNVSDISGLAGLPILNFVAVDYNSVTDLSPLLECPTIVRVDAFANEVGDVSKLLDEGVIVNYDPTYVAPKPAEDEEDEGDSDG